LKIAFWTPENIASDHLDPGTPGWEPLV